MNSAEVLIKFKADTSDVNRTTKSMGGLTKSITLGNLAAKGIAKGFQVMSSQMGSAIKRVDTFNNFPRVMKNFGVSNDEAKKSIDRMDKAMRGLPTSLDQAVAGVQDLFLVTKNLPEAEKMFKAINDSAMVFAKGSTEAVDRFVYAFKQSMAAGKVSAQDFKQMSDAIPGLMDKVAESMGISFAELKEGLSNGKISMDDFNNAMKKLDTEGGAGMKALEKSARDATGGIETAITNMKTAITRGLGNALDALDKSLKDAGLGGLSGVIASIGDAFEKVLKAIVPAIPPLVKALANIFKWMQKHEKLVKTLAIVFASFIAIVKTISIVSSIIGPIITIFKILLTVIKFVGIAFKILGAIMIANPIGAIIAIVIALIAIFVILWKKCEGFRNFWKGLWEGIKTATVAAWNFIKGIFTQVIDFVKNNWKQILLFLVNPFAGAFALLYKHNEKFRNAVNNLVNKVVGFFKSIPGKIKAIPGKMFSFFKSLPSKILNIFKSLPSKMLNTGLNIVKGIGRGITSGTTWIKSKIKEFTNNVKNDFKLFFGIKSPSKWTNKMIGQNLMLGVGEGLNKQKGTITRQMAGIVKGMEQQLAMNTSLSPNVSSSTSTHFSPNIQVNVQNNMTTDPLGQVVNKVKTFSGGAKNDYNYGR